MGECDCQRPISLATHLLRLILPVGLEMVILSYWPMVGLVWPCAIVPRNAFFDYVLESMLGKVNLWKIPILLSCIWILHSNIMLYSLS